MRHKIGGLALNLVGILLFPILATSAANGWGAAAAGKDPLLDAMQRELHRAGEQLGKLDPAPYYTSYSVSDTKTTFIVASLGSLLNSTQLHRRMGSVMMRVGSPALDNTHGDGGSSAIESAPLPLQDDQDAIARVLWQLTYQEYRKASKSFLNIKTASRVRSKEEDDSPDFSQEKPHTHFDPKVDVGLVDSATWEERLRRYSGYFRDFPEIFSSGIFLLSQETQLHFAAGDGSSVVSPNTVVRMVIEGETVADDGMELLRVETFQASNSDQLPGESEIHAKILAIASDLKALKAAPVAEPFDGPALLSGRAAAVFFHEVLGHRLEGRRQRSEEEGQTFTKMVNQQVLPLFLSVTDDPTQRKLNGLELGGWYEFDDEGMPANRVDVIQKGILKSFLMSRMPVKGFANSNGHGRAQAGSMPIGRQGNLIVTSSQTVKDADLRQKLIEEVQKQGKPYGLYFEDIEGGFTLTTRSAPQAFQVLPVMVWRVYADGRADELVRGVDIVGTPLAALNRIEVTGEKVEVFNGICGAESGSIPVAAAAPAMLFSEVEVQKRAHGHARPPLLPSPGFEQLRGTSAAKDGRVQ
jgi:TldD protein